jgi:protein-tyrosine phosphatase
MKKFGYGPAFADERIVFGAQRPGYPSHRVNDDDIAEWIDCMQGDGIKCVCCLLTPDQLGFYGNGLLNTYLAAFGQQRVSSIPIEDFHLCSPTLLRERILPFLEKSDIKGEKVVVHCSGGSGRTGLVLAGWLVFRHGLSVDEALATVKKNGRNPLESVEQGNATMSELRNLLAQCQKGVID